MPQRLSEIDKRLMEHLRASGVVDGLVLDELVEVQQAHWKPFGRIAVELGYLRIVQVAKVLSYQATSPGQAFGETARCLGFLRSAHVDEILKHQRGAIPSLAEVLIAEMVMEPGEVAELLHDALPLQAKSA